MLHQFLEAVVPVDHAPIQVVQVARGKPATVKWHKWPQIRRDNRNHIEDHPYRIVALVGFVTRVAKCVHNLEPLERLLLTMLTGFRQHRLAQLVRDLVDIETA